MIKSLSDQKIYLIKLYIVLKNINIFQDMTLGIIDKNGRKIVNFLQFVNANNIYSMDKFFVQFVDELNSWWLHNIIDMEYEPKR